MVDEVSMAVSIVDRESVVGVSTFKGSASSVIHDRGRSLWFPVQGQFYYSRMNLCSLLGLVLIESPLVACFRVLV